MKKFFTLSALALVASVAVADNMALKVTCPEGKANPWDSQVFINFPTPLEAGKAYTLLMDVKGSVALEPKAGQYGPEAIQPIMQDNNSDNRDEWNGPADLQYLAHFTVTEDWVKGVKDCDGNAIVSDGKFPYSRLLLNLGLYAGDFYIDNLRLVDAEGAEACCITFDTAEEQALVENGWMNLPKAFVTVEGGSSDEPGDEPAGNVVLWSNETGDAIPAWGGTFRFCNVEHMTGEEIYAFPMDHWTLIKEGTVRAAVETTASSNIRITTGWWDGTYGGTDYNCLALVQEEADGTKYVELNIKADGNMYDLIDDHHLLFTGDAYTLKSIYVVGNTSIATVEEVPAATVTFNLMGQQTNATSGLMIRNGKLIMVK